LIGSWKRNFQAFLEGFGKVEMARPHFVDKGFQIAKIVLFGLPSRAKGKAGLSPSGRS